MKTIAVISQKGGVGKTTLATNLAIAAEHSGTKTVLLDLDPQASASVWNDARDEEAPLVTSIQAVRMPQTLEAAKEMGAGLVVIDPPPKARDVAAQCAELADLVLIPTRPAFLDLDAMMHALEIVRQFNTPAVVVLNFVKPFGRTAEQTEEVVTQLAKNIAVARIGDRIAFQHAQARGLGVLEYEPSGKASEEIWNLHSHVWSTLGLGQKARQHVSA